MKRTVNTSFLILFVVGLLSMAPTKTETLPLAKLAFETEIIDYGTILQGENGTKIFKFENTGDAPFSHLKSKNQLWLYCSKVLKRGYCSR